MLTKAMAAGYCSMGVERFATTCPVAPVEMARGVLRYDRKNLDRWLDELTNGRRPTEDELLARFDEEDPRRPSRRR